MVVREDASVGSRQGVIVLWVMSCLVLSAMTWVSMKGISEDLTRWHIVYFRLTMMLGGLSLLSAWFGRPKWSSLDVLFLLWVLTKGISVWVHGNGFSVSWSESLVDAVVYFSLRQMLSSNLPERLEPWREGLILLLLSVPTVSECLSGTSQLLGLSHSHHSLYDMTGSFFNPGPYGGWLMLGLTVFGMASLKCSHWLRYVYLMLAVWPMLLLPFTLSRAACLGAATALSVGVVCHASLIPRWREALHQSRKKTLFRTVAALIVGGLLCAGAYIIKKPSADGRMFVNRMSLVMMSQHPWLGCGPGQFAGEYGHTQEAFFTKRLPESTWDTWTMEDVGTVNQSRYVKVADCPSRAFNEYFQTGVEYGLLPMILMLALAFAGVWIGCRRSPVFSIAWLALSVFACFSYPFSLIPFRLWAMILLASVAQSDIRSWPRCSWLHTLSLCLLISLSALQMSPYRRHQEALSEWQKMRTWYQCEYYDSVVENYAGLYADMSDDYRFLFEYGRALCMEKHFEESIRVLEAGARISSDPMFFNVMGNSYKALGEVEMAENCYHRAFIRVPNRLYPLYLTAKLYAETGREEALAHLVPWIEAFEPKVPSPATDRMKAELKQLGK